MIIKLSTLLTCAGIACLAVALALVAPARPSLGESQDQKSVSAGQTPGMKMHGLVAVSRDGEMLDPATACLRGLGYFISIAPLMLGFVWALIDPEHLTWADKVSGTYLKKL